MSRPYYASEILETIHEGGHELEVVAVIEASHDANAERLHARLDAFLREVNQRGPDAVTRPGWLPKPQDAIEGVGASESTALARDLFRRWVGHVREALHAHREG